MEWQKSINDGRPLVEPQPQATHGSVWAQIVDMVAICASRQGRIPSAWQKTIRVDAGPAEGCGIDRSSAVGGESEGG
jgi:hypothetical protein